jgi:hypothetical protein
MVRPGARRVAPILLTCALVLPVAGGCGGAGMEAGGSADSLAREPVPTARMSPPGEPRRETQTLVKGTTGWVGGLRLGVGRVAEDVATLIILEGQNVPSQGNWRVSGEAGHSEKLANGYTVTIEKVMASSEDGGQETSNPGPTSGTGSDAGPGSRPTQGPVDGSVTVTVTPPPE